MVSFAENLYLWRISRGLSQEELAKKAGIPRPNLSAMESGKREPSLATLRVIAASLRTTPGVLINGVAPIHFKKSFFTRESLEAVVQASLGENTSRITTQQKALSLILSGLIKNRINANNKIYRNIFKSRQTYINNWLILKAALGPEVLNNLLTRLDKHIEIDRH